MGIPTWGQIETAAVQAWSGKSTRVQRVDKRVLGVKVLTEDLNVLATSGPLW